MTVCIAALAEDGKKMVLAADTMLTAPAFGSYEMEPEQGNKITSLSSHVYALFSGWAPHCLAIIEKAKPRILSTDSTERCAQILKEELEKYRNEWLESGLLRIRGIPSLQDYYGRHQTLQNTLVVTIDNEINNGQNLFTQNVFFIVAGKDEEACSILSVLPNTNITPDDGTGYMVIGSGANIAGYTLLDSGYKKSLELQFVEKKVRFAKKKSEKAQGVGTGIQLITLS